MKKLTNISYLLALVILVFCPLFAMVDGSSDYSADEDGGNSVIEMLGSMSSL